MRHPRDITESLTSLLGPDGVNPIGGVYWQNQSKKIRDNQKLEFDYPSIVWERTGSEPIGPSWDGESLRISVRIYIYAENQADLDNLSYEVYDKLIKESEIKITGGFEDSVSSEQNTFVFSTYIDIEIQ